VLRAQSVGPAAPQRLGAHAARNLLFSRYQPGAARQ